MSREEHKERGAGGIGVSVAICCHNSAHVLPETLAYLKKQHGEPDLRWELVVIDNASEDDTAQVAHSHWKENAPAPIRVLHEPRLGLCYARERAFEEARYEVVTFIDDDNWITADWLKVVREIMSGNPEVGAIGSTNRAIADVTFPPWFSRYSEFYAAWASAESPTIPKMLNGAGMTVRRDAWEELKRQGFRPQLTDRVGKRLTSFGDVELGLALKLAGWKILIDPRLQLQHYMTERRLTWRYLRSLMRGAGTSNVVLDSYFYVPERCGRGFRDRLRVRYWWWHFLSEARRLIARHSTATLLKACLYELEGNDDIADIEWRVGRLMGLLRLRSGYITLRREIAHAPWRRRSSPYWDLPSEPYWGLPSDT